MKNLILITQMKQIKRKRKLFIKYIIYNNRNQKVDQKLTYIINYIKMQLLKEKN